MTWGLRRRWREWAERCKGCGRSARLCQSKGQPESKPPHWVRTPEGELRCPDCAKSPPREGAPTL